MTIPMPYGPTIEYRPCRCITGLFARDRGHNTRDGRIAHPYGDGVWVHETTFDNIAAEKHLTDPETAAIYWKAAAGLYALGYRHEEMERQRHILGRFALNPHAFENGDDQ